MLVMQGMNHMIVFIDRYAPPSMIHQKVEQVYDLYDTVQGLNTEQLLSMLKFVPKTPCLADIMAAVDALADKDMEALSSK